MMPSSKSSTSRTAPASAAKQSAVPKRVVQLSDILSVAAGANHTVVACARGVYSFGCNAHGQLGLGTCVDSHVPVRVKALSQSRDNVTQVAAGVSHSLFICGSSRVFAAGSCDLGQFHAASSGMAAAATSSTSGERRPMRATPMRIQLPFIDGAAAASKGVLLHEGKAGGHASVFLIRAPDDPVCPVRCVLCVWRCCSRLCCSPAHAAPCLLVP